MMSAGGVCFREKTFEDKYEAIELFLTLQRSLYSNSTTNPATAELALMKMIDAETFLGVYIGDVLSVSLHPCDKCFLYIYN